MLRLGELLEGVTGATLEGDPGLPVHEVRDDSRKVGPGDLFVAVPGTRQDGARFVHDALAAGATAVVLEGPGPSPRQAGVAWVTVPSARRALGIIAANRFGAAKALTLTAVTGTSGKTTMTYLLESILLAAGRRTGVVGTVSNRYPGRATPSSHTTPGPLELHSFLAELRAAGGTDAVMETTSHAIDQGRVAGCSFRVAGLTNVTQDHLDYHLTHEAYFEAKAALFRDLVSGTSVLFADREDGRRMRAAVRGAVLTVATTEGVSADVRVIARQLDGRGTRATLATPVGDIEIVSPMVGGYNLENLTLAVGMAIAHGLPAEAIRRGIAALSGVPGRLERVGNDAGVLCLVDYSHKPDALDQALVVLRPLTRGRIILVFGCGGDRDQTKRPIMGETAARRAEVVVVTSDNPRTEDPMSIIGMIVPGVLRGGGVERGRAALGRGEPGYFVEPDRREAIRAAVAIARPGDTVLIAGKGHEDYQILGTTKIHFDDREEAAAAFAGPARRSLGEACLAMGGELISGPPDVTFAGAASDSRLVQKGNLFFALKGERTDGFEHCGMAVRAGAVALVVPAGRGVPEGCEGLPVVAVADPRLALGALARAARDRFAGKVVGITGSNGKTTTRALTAAALATAGTVMQTAGNLNTDVGLPLTVLAATGREAFWVLEMAMRARGEIAYLAELSQPHVALVTSIGAAHLGRLGSLEEVARAKGEIYGALGESGIAILPEGEALLEREAAALPAERKRRFGSRASRPGDVRILEVTPAGASGSVLRLAVGDVPVVVRLPLAGEHNARNAAAALAVVAALGVPVVAAAAALEKAPPPPHRSRLVAAAGRTILDDTYNANPTSMVAALTTVASAPGGGGRAFAVLGDMGDLGDGAEASHVELGKQVARAGLAGLVTVGPMSRSTARAAREAGMERVASVDGGTDAAKAMADWTAPGDWVLVKASRAMKLEEAVAALEAAAGEGGDDVKGSFALSATVPGGGEGKGEVAPPPLGVVVEEKELATILVATVFELLGGGARATNGATSPLPSPPRRTVAERANELFGPPLPRGFVN